MYLIPFTHDKMEVQRLPFITLGLIALNILVFIATSIQVSGMTKTVRRNEDALVDYYSERPYLKMPDAVLEKLSSENHVRIEVERHQTNIMNPTILDQEPEYEEKEAFKELVESYLKSFDNHPYNRYGYIPAKGGFVTLITCMFIHGGFFHLLFNMLFLWLAGGALEDLWGRVLFPAFYAIGGIVASMSHAFIYPYSSEALIGASGAVSALMGAFLIRLYSTRIKFFYGYFLGVSFRHGTFRAPAYIMLPLWLLQQFWDLGMHGGSEEVAFLAHIGGFVFGAGFAAVLKASRLEEKYIAPLLDKKTNLLSDASVEGARKLEEGDLDGAVLEFRHVLAENPDDPLAHGDLCRIYFKQGKDIVARKEMNRAVEGYMQSDFAEGAIDFYLEVAAEHPDAVLDAPLQFKLASLMEEKDRYGEAAETCWQLAKYYPLSLETLDHPEVLAAVAKYADLCLNRLDRPMDAYTALRMLQYYEKHLTDDQKKELDSNLKKAEEASGPNGDEESETKKAPPDDPVQTEAPATQPAGPAIPLKDRIRLSETLADDIVYEVQSLAPREAGKIAPIDGGLDPRLLTGETIAYDNIYYICVFTTKTEAGKIYLDLFIAGESRPYRVSSNTVNYNGFFKKLEPTASENFHKFIGFVISRISSLYLDRGTMAYLKTKNPMKFNSMEEVKLHEKKVWRKLINQVRFACGNCHEAYWLDRSKIPGKGARTKCRKCGNVITIRNQAALDRLPESV